MSRPFAKELEVAQELAKNAGIAVKAMQKTSTFTFKKDGNGPVSQADFLADEIIQKGLSSHFPHDIIVSEESADETAGLPKAHRVWLVDPIDGTSDFVRGGQDYCVMIGLLINGAPTLGVVYAPETDTLWSAIYSEKEGENSVFLQRNQNGAISMVPTQTFPKAVHPIVIASKNHPSPLADKIAEALQPSKVTRMGSLGLKLAAMAEGQADLYIAATRRIKVWDTCAPFVILLAAGGLIHTFSQNEVPFGPTLSHGTPFFAVSERFLEAFSKRLSDSDLAFIKDL